MLNDASLVSPTAAALELHRRQRERVAASLRTVPGASRSTHRRWA